MVTKSETSYKDKHAFLEEKNTQFVKNLVNLNEVNRGAMATLRRNVGNSISESHNALNVFYPLLPYEIVQENYQEILFMIATIFAIHPYTIESGNLAFTIKSIQEDRNKKSIDKRLQALLDEEVFQNTTIFSHRLSQLIQIAKSNYCPINYVKLATDLMFWDSDKRFIQKEWARAYYQQNFKNKGDKK